MLSLEGIGQGEISLSFRTLHSSFCSSIVASDTIFSGLKSSGGVAVSYCRSNKRRSLSFRCFDVTDFVFDLSGNLPCLNIKITKTTNMQTKIATLLHSNDSMLRSFSSIPMVHTNKKHIARVFLIPEPFGQLSIAWFPTSLDNYHSRPHKQVVQTKSL